MNTQEIFYSDDVNLEDHTSFIVYQHQDGYKVALSILRLETEQHLIYSIELFNKVSDSWINEDDLKSLNSYADTNYQFDTVLTDIQQYQFSSDLVSYYGAENFDSTPYNISNYNSFIEYLKDLNLI
jgi:hypothetical protein